MRHRGGEWRLRSSVDSMTPSPKLVAVAPLLLGACSGIPLPGQSPEQFFARCMASFGYEVFDVTAGGAVEDCCGFATEAEAGPAFDGAMFHCEERVRERFG
jgi:hypothetical protein